MMETVRLTTAKAIVTWLVAQRTVVDGAEVPLFPGVFAIFGHGNVTCLGHALEQARPELITWRGQNEQGMALAAIAYAKVMRRRQVMVATSSIGPGALNMVTAAGVAMANRLPVLLLAGDTFVSRVPDPVLQQIEHRGTPGITANDAFRPVVRYWDRIVRPEQIVQSLPQALSVLLDPAECGPAFLALPQDVQAEAFDFPVSFFEPTVHVAPRPRPDPDELGRAASILRSSKRPLIIAGGGVHYSLAESELSLFAAKHGLPVVETVAGKSSLVADDPAWIGPIGVIGSDPVNHLAEEADVVLAVGTRLQDFTTGSWTMFPDESLQIVNLNAARFDAVKHRSHPLVGDALLTLRELSTLIGNWRGPDAWLATSRTAAAEHRQLVSNRTSESAGLPSYAQVVGAVQRTVQPDDYLLTASGGFPGELNANWLSSDVASFDCEYGFSCMGYEISGGWGAAMGRPSGKVIVLLGDGSYLMQNSDLYSAVLSGTKMIVVVCDNGGFACIERLQLAQGGVSFNNLYTTSNIVDDVRVDFSAHAGAMGCESERVSTIRELEKALQRAHASSRTTVIVLSTDSDRWTDGGAFWEVGVPEVSEREEVRAARRAMDEGKTKQRIGW